MNILVEAKEASYNDEHAHVQVWNHMTGASGSLKKSIAHDKTSMVKELAKAKTDKKHPLHFNNAPESGFVGGKKTDAHKDSYHKELDTAVHTVHALAQRPEFKKAIAGGHKAEVMGASKGEVSSTWKQHGATKGATSKSDVSIYNPKSGKKEGLRLSMKKGAGSQLMSGGSEENKAVHDHAAREMLNTHKDYKNLPTKTKNEIHGSIMKKMDEVGKHINAMKTTPRSKWEGLKNKAQSALDSVHDAHPALNHFVRKEATTGQGKFGGSEHAASYLVKSAAGKIGASVKHVDEIKSYEGPRPRAALPKGDGRPGNIKLDERPEKIHEQTGNTFRDFRKAIFEDSPANSMGSAGISGLGANVGAVAGRDKLLGDPKMLRRKALELLQKKYEKS